MMPKILSELQILTPLIINSRDPQISGMGKSAMISRQQPAVLFTKKKNMRSVTFSYISVPKDQTGFLNV